MASGALGHAERPTVFPDGLGAVPAYRTDGPALVVCKPDTAERLPLLSAEARVRNLALLPDCAFEHIQDAVNAVTQQGSRILVLPGLYREEPSLAPPPTGCEGHYELTSTAGRQGYLMSYAQQLACPHAQNLIAILGDPDDSGVGNCGPRCNLQIEGTGDHPNDVVIDADYRKLNGVRADRANGFGLFNLTAQRTEFNAVYILEQDGFVIDNVVTRWNYEYGFLTFSADNGLYKDCEVYGSGDAGLYPGSAADIHAGQGNHDALDPARYATVIQNCTSHHNALGYSGTAGNSVHMHDSRLVHNGIGITTDSLFPDHPGLPQDHARWENNVIAHNNMNYYHFYTETLADGRSACDVDRPYAERGFEHGVVCPNVGIPVGSGVLIAGGNWNLIRGNDIYDNWRYGGMQFNVPALLREDTDPSRQFDTSHHNQWRDNRLGRAPEGWDQPMGDVDFWWDDQGEGNCWQGNTSSAGAIRSNAPHLQPTLTSLPDCDSGGSVSLPEPLAVPNLAKSAQILPCAEFDRYDNPRPSGCPWMDDPPVPDGRQPARASVARHAGTDRVATAIALSEAIHHMTGDMAGQPRTVILARADDYADALVAAPLAARLSAPILLTGRDALDPRVAAELHRLLANRVILMGGTAALSDAVTAQVGALGIGDVGRVAGTNRFDTAARVARMMGGSQAYLVEGTHADPNRGWPDAVAVSGLAAAQLRPILLTVHGALPTETAAAIQHLGVRNLSIVGGTAAVSDAVAQRARQLSPHVERLSGPDRYATAAVVAERSVFNVMDPHTLWVVTGGNWPDALTAGAAAGTQGGIVLMVPGWRDTLEGATADWHAGRYHPTDRVKVAGGLAAVSPGVAAAFGQTGG
jgi:putative cell wall-binding protein